jgi:hypothetical protein
MPVVYPGATLTPHFRDFLPGWMARQPWYRGSGQPSLHMVGAFRLEDPAGEVGIETHLLTDGAAIYQVPMTYRGAALAGSGLAGSGLAGPGLAGSGLADSALIATAEHSVLGTRWIYDGPSDPVWVGQLLQLVADEGVSGPGGRPRDARARGLRRSQADPTAMATSIELRRVLTAGPVPAEPGTVGVVMGSWQPDNCPPDCHVHGCLAVVRELRRRRA